MPARVDDAARKLIEEHGPRAVHIAVERLNQSIDERDHSARDFWAQVVHAIHECQRSVWLECVGCWRAARGSRRIEAQAALAGLAYGRLIVLLYTFLSPKENGGHPLSLNDLGFNYLDHPCQFGAR